MVIIKRQADKQSSHVRSKRTFLGITAVVLALLVAISSFALSIPMVSARGETAFVDCEEIFIDLRSFTGWSEASASFRVFTFYNDSYDEHYCHEYEGNFDNDGWYIGQNVLARGIVPVKFCNNVYSFRIPANNLSHLRIVRTNSSGTEKWDLSPYMWDNQRSKYNAGGKTYSTQNAIKITGWDNMATWSTFTPTNNASYSETTAVPDSSITGNSNLYTIDATFYDYYNDDEIQNGWGQIRKETNHGKNRTSENGNGYMENAYWEPYQYLNSRIASHDSGVNYPLYFGNFYDKEDHFKGEGSSNMVNFSNWVNNSSRLGGTHKAVVGLTGSTLVNGDLVYATNGGGNSSTKVPIFDKSWLSANRVGSVVNTKFPMRKVTQNGVTGYYFDSSSSAANGGDNVWFNSNHTSISYGAGTSNGAKDSLSYYNSDGSTSGYGFFPFDSTRGTSADALDYGFGMRVDVKFNIGMNGKNNGIDEVFSFTGDDDVWVYIDGNLVLDLGGDHQKASGTINFANKSVSVSTGSNTLNSATRNTGFAINNTDPTVEHTLTMFYVERGMVESNLSFNFNFAPVGNEYIVDKTVNTTSVNSGLSSDVAAADTFTFTQPTANGKVSSKGTISNSKFTLKDGESISFKDQFTVPTTMTVTESESSPLEYTTAWKAVDLVLKGKGAASSQYTIAQSSGDSKIANFDYKTLDTSSEFAMTRVQLSYENTPKVRNVNLTKVVSGLDSGSTDTTDFDGKVQISLDNGSTWITRQLAYTATGVSGTKYLTSAGKLASGAKLRNNRTLTFAGIPEGALFRFVEDTPASGYSYVSTVVSGKTVTAYGNGGSFTVTGSNNSMTVTNKRQSGNDTLTVYKTINGMNYSGDQFTFSMAPIAASGCVTGTAPANVTAVSDGEVTFSLNFTQPGKYRYSISEQRISTELAQQGYGGDGLQGKTYYVEFNVADSGDGLKITYLDGLEPKFYSDSSFTSRINSVTFQNTFSNDVTVKKVVEGYDDLNNADIADAVFDDDTFAYTIGIVDGTSFDFAIGISYTHTDYAGDSSLKSTGDFGAFDLQDQESAKFEKQFDTGSTISVSENSAKNLLGQTPATLEERYTTRWDLYDGSTKITDSAEAGDNYVAEFNLVGHENDATHTENPAIPADLKVTFYNKLNTDSLILVKKVNDEGGSDITSTVNENFTFNVRMTLSGKGSYQTYPFNYEIGTYKNGVFTKQSTAYSTDGTVSFAPQKAIRIYGLPVGTKYTVSETDIPNGYTLDGSNNKVGFVGKTRVQTFTNIQSEGVDTITVTKLVDEMEYSGDQFKFEMAPIQTQSTATKTYRTGEAPDDAATVTNGAVSFELSFTQVGWYRYSISETPLGTDLTNMFYSGDAKTYYVEFEVVEDASDHSLKISTDAAGKPRYYSDAAFTAELPNGVVFKNTVQPAKITVNKDNQADEPLPGTVFAVVKVKDSTPLSEEQINDLIKNHSANYMKGEIKADGSRVFENLPIYQNGDLVYDNSKPVGSSDQWFDGANYLNGDPVSQTYMVFEYSPVNGYNRSYTTKFVTFPHEDALEITFDYTNVAVVDPMSGGSGMQIFLSVGFGIFGTALLMAAAYCVSVRKRRARYKAAHGRRFKK